MWTQGQLLQSGKYRVIRRVGRGGFGLTYLAVDSFFNRQVVVKTPNDTFQADRDYEKFVRRFQREGQALAKVSHPNVVSVIDFFEEAGMPCLVMAYVEGQNLHERIRDSGPLTENEAVRIFQKLAKALDHVHTSGIFHCDIHPGNIILKKDDEPVLIDFGSAKTLHPSTFTVTTTINESFVPYEQRNRKNEPKAAWDVYGLAATLYFSVVGEKASPAIDRKAYNEALEIPSPFSTELSDWLCKSILKGMALEAQNRPSAMQDWLAFLHPPQASVETLTLIEESINEKQVLPQQKEVVESQRQVASHIPDSLLFPREFRDLRIGRSKPQKSVFPWTSTSLLLLSNIPTGICLWMIGTSAATQESAPDLVLFGIFSIVGAGATAWTWVRDWAGVRAGALAGAVTVAVFATSAGAGFVACVGAGAWGLSLARAGAWAWAWAGAGACALSWTWTLTGAWTLDLTLTGAWTLAGILGAVWIGLKSRNLQRDAYWTGSGASSMTLAGFAVGSFSELVEEPIQAIGIAVLGLLQIVLMAQSVRSMAVSLSNRYRSQIKPFIILNAACAIGILCGAWIAWMLLPITDTAA